MSSAKNNDYEMTKSCPDLHEILITDLYRVLANHLIPNVTAWVIVGWPSSPTSTTARRFS